MLIGRQRSFFYFCCGVLAFPHSTHIHDIHHIYVYYICRIKKSTSIYVYSPSSCIAILEN